jgi:hypothetical protein
MCIICYYHCPTIVHILLVATYLLPELLIQQIFLVRIDNFLSGQVCELITWRCKFLTVSDRLVKCTTLSTLHCIYDKLIHIWIRSSIGTYIGSVVMSSWDNLAWYMWGLASHWKVGLVFLENVLVIGFTFIHFDPDTRENVILEF